MKNLLLNAVEELVVKANKEIDDARNDIKVMEHKGAKLNRVYDAHGYIINLIDRINVLKDKLTIDFPEEEDAIEKMWSNNNLDSGEEAVITNIRHKNLIFEAIEEADNSIDALKSDLPVDMISINIKTILEMLGAIVGQNVSEETINGIFSRFCLGK